MYKYLDIRILTCKFFYLRLDFFHKCRAGLGVESRDRRRYEGHCHGAVGGEEVRVDNREAHG